MASQPFLDAEHAHRVRQAIEEVRAGDAFLACIGNTPLVRLDRINPTSRVKIYGKLESCNPGGSVKDRLALYLFVDAIAKGLLTRERGVLEASSGNTGIAMAMIGARLGYRVVITLADNLSLERYKVIGAYGAELVITPGALGTQGAIDKARELVAADASLVWLGQHQNEVNSFGHYETTGKEIVQQLADLGERRIDAVIATSGTTGTLMGVSARVKESHPEAKIVAVWPKGDIMGLRRPEGAKRPGIYRDSLVDRIVEITNDMATATVERSAKQEGMFLGPSAGAALTVALDTARGLEQTRGEGVVVAILPDSGERYLSVGIDRRQPFRG